MFRTGIACVLFLFVLNCSAHALKSEDFHPPRITNAIDTVKKANLLKKLSDAIKFRKNAITREQKRVQAIIEKMIKKDSSVATVQDIEKLRQELTESNKLQLDMLLDLIKEIKIPENAPASAQEAPGAAVPNAGSKPFQVTKELDPNDKYINDLVDRLVPVLTDSKAADVQEKNRHERLKLMRLIYSNKNTFTDTLNDTTAIRYRIKLGHRAEVIGSYAYDRGYNANKYNLSTLSTLAYHAYELDEFTGMSKNLHHWDDAVIVAQAKEAGDKVLLTVTTKNSAETARFLSNEIARKNMITNTLDLLERRNGDGVNIALKGLSKRLRPFFADFIRALSQAYRAKIKQYQVSITLPAFDDNQAYDIARLDTLVDRFIIDFTKKPTGFPGPVAPLNDESDYSIQASVSKYLNAGLPPYKFVLGLSYYGAEFSLNPGNGTETFKRYVPYSEIRVNYPYAPITFNEKAAFASLETRDADGTLTGHIYYDNEASLEKKYDFVLDNGLGGVAIWHLGADEGYGELWDALAFKFVKIDTVSQETITLHAVKKKDNSIFGYIKTNLVAYYHALQHPCDTSYDQPETLLLTIINIFLALLSVVTAIVLISQIREKGENWKWKKALIRVLIVSVNLFIITIFMWLYIDSSVPWFGAGEDCIDMPFTILLLIIITGIVLGTIIMRFLIFPVLQRDEKP